MIKNQNITKTELYSTLTGIFTVSLILSNIIAFKTFVLWESLNIVLPCAVIIFPILYIVSDILAEVYGYEKTKKVIYLGFGLNLLAVIVYHIAIILPAPAYFTGSESFEIVLSNSLRVLIASFIAYIVGSLINAKVMVLLKSKSEKNLFIRCISSTLFGEGADAMIFITITFFGTMPFEILLTMIIAQALFKTIYEIIIYPLTRTVIEYIKKLPQ